MSRPALGLTYELSCPKTGRVSGISIIHTEGSEDCMSYTMDQLKIGQKARFSKTISECDVYLFAGVTGDTNPAHLNTEYAKDTVFKKRIAHGMLSASLISTVLGTELPGKGTIYLRQEVTFLRPVHFEDTITAVVEVVGKDERKNRVTLKTTCLNQEGVVVVDGEATVIPPCC